MNVSRGKMMKNAFRTSLIKQVYFITIYVEIMLKCLNMLSSSDHVKVSETKWQYRKNRYLPGHVRKGKEAVFCLFFSFSIYDSELWKCICLTIK